ncbi:MAG TPA: aminoglycoside phosphotransferase family protein [Pilimelia sp.]|nr:aminoglycoside phosphotransferase family protein [Pilimelia sp.]
MRAISLPAVPYEATAQRPDWADLPAAVRTAIADRLGSPVVAARTARGGFTQGFTAVLTTAAGDEHFVKAAALTDLPHLADWYAREAALTAALPPAVPAPRPRWTATLAGHYVLCAEAVPGARMPALPWRPDELTATLAALAATAAALREPPAALTALGLPRLSDFARADLSTWAPVAAGHAPMPPAPALARARLRDLVALEQTFIGYADSPAVIHSDLRADNVVLDGAGAAWLCDWSWPCHGVPWFDTAILLVTAFASGLDADALFAGHPTTRGAPPDALDAVLAAGCGYWFARASDAPPDGSPYLRAHQRWSGEQALAWLAARRGWA